ncbi:MAG: hypothetical protein KF908_15170 [Nitrosomonas sp.]|nr:hypothetical protein [Nitrosomonas sp.]MCW5608988.1 hypothetical protein [Nitrosomonas sp.]
MENEKMVTLQLTELQFGQLFEAYLFHLDDVLDSSDLSDEDKRLTVEDLESVGLVLWNALPAFVPVHLVRSVREIDWGYRDESK